VGLRRADSGNLSSASSVVHIQCSFFLSGFVSFVSMSFHLFMLRSVLMFPKFCGFFFCFCFDESAFGVLNVYAKRNFYGV